MSELVDLMKRLPENLIPEVNAAAHAALKNLLDRVVKDDELIGLEQDGEHVAVLMSKKVFEEYSQAMEIVIEQQDGSRRLGDLS
jgi:PHD/YefM family antitoxin component YafN of YafNO toxin-antitoxin module